LFRGDKVPGNGHPGGPLQKVRESKDQNWLLQKMGEGWSRGKKGLTYPTIKGLGIQGEKREGEGNGGTVGKDCIFPPWGGAGNHHTHKKLMVGHHTNNCSPKRCGGGGRQVDLSREKNLLPSKAE